MHGPLTMVSRTLLHFHCSWFMDGPLTMVSRTLLHFHGSWFMHGPLTMVSRTLLHFHDSWFMHGPLTMVSRTLLHFHDSCMVLLPWWAEHCYCDECPVISVTASLPNLLPKRAGAEHKLWRMSRIDAVEHKDVPPQTTDHCSVITLRWWHINTQARIRERAAYGNKPSICKHHGSTNVCSVDIIKKNHIHM